MFRAMTDSSLSAALKNVLGRIQSAAQRRTPDLTGSVPRLVAVSKTKPVESIVELYQCGHYHFVSFPCSDTGNVNVKYPKVQELVEKASNPKILELKDIKWHFIGHLQRNKCNNLTAAPNLYMVETVDTTKLATALNNSWGKQDKSYNLKVMVQVNTSEETNKSGCTPESCCDIVKHILETCPKLQFAGLMTIGALGSSVEEEGRNPDFEALVACRKDVCKKLNLEIGDVELSMGMSADFEQAFCPKYCTRRREKPTLKRSLSPPPGFQAKVTQVSCSEFPFSKHDNRQAFRGHGIYFGSAGACRSASVEKFEMGFGKRKQPEKRHQCSNNFPPLIPTKTPKSSYTTSYTAPATSSSSNNEQKHRRYPYNYTAKSSCAGRPDANMKLLTPLDSFYKTPLHVLAITQKPFLHGNTWVYSYKPKEYNRILGL